MRNALGQEVQSFPKYAQKMPFSVYTLVLFMLQEEISEDDDIVHVLVPHSLDFSAIMTAEFGRLSILSLVI